ncbi:Endoribonuclease L-PSP/chorismate mutase-like protein [Papiliotrema laurentii]|uniref:Endoribonuclease L-PSP/chorismate mutase-like protein n=1 Tax=Papiliotrema laurentii TaxID=5418 RepID=A0AAD9FPR0_PAPLA|nr:Endoribonuclease L-PSP/chorismate mutase-like protein [Papiliotrema laurentii]
MSTRNKIAVVDPSAPKANPFTSNMIVSGSSVYLSGVVGVDANGQFVEGTIQDRTRAALGVAKRRLALLGLDLGDVVSVQIFLVDYNSDFASMNAAYIPEFPKDTPMPCRTCVGIATLPGRHDIEMTIIAAKRDVAKL